MRRSRFLRLLTLTVKIIKMSNLRLFSQLLVFQNFFFISPRLHQPRSKTASRLAVYRCLPISHLVFDVHRYWHCIGTGVSNLYTIAGGGGERSGGHPLRTSSCWNVRHLPINPLSQNCAQCAFSEPGDCALTVSIQKKAEKTKGYNTKLGKYFMQVFKNECANEIVIRYTHTACFDYVIHSYKAIFNKTDLVCLICTYRLLIILYLVTGGLLTNILISCSN